MAKTSPAVCGDISGRVLLAAALAVGVVAVGCGDAINGSDRVSGSGDEGTESRSVLDFDRIVLAGEGQVIFASGTDGLIEIETDDNLLTHIETDVSGDTLTISTARNVDIDPTDGVIYRLGCPELTGVTLTGAGSVDLAACTTSDRLDLELAGAGTIVAPALDLSSLGVSLPGAGSIVVSGLTDQLVVVMAGAGDFEGADLRATIADVDSPGVGSAALWVTDDLDLRLSGVGSVRFYGDPTVSQSITGVGTIEALGPK